MLIEHRGKRPTIHETAYVAPTATISGDVTIAADTRVLFGAILTAEGGPMTIGRRCIVMENAVLRSSKRHPLRLADNILVGPRSYLSGCTIEDNAFLATGTTVFNGSTISERAEVRVNGVVHLKSRLGPGDTVPIGWVAVGDPAQIFPPEAHEQIWAIQKAMNFPMEIFGVERPAEGESKMPQVAERYTRALAKHFDDEIVE